MGRLRSIQILRAIAALGVVGVHVLIGWENAARTLAPSGARMGAYGVDLFFVISGYIVCNVARRASSATSFLRSRFIRVAPVYYVQSLPWLLGALVGGKPLLCALATTLLFWPFWGREPTLPLLVVGWTLCFEALFYSSLSFVVRWKTPATIVLGGAYALALGLNAAGVGGPVRFVGSPLLLEFLLGVAIAGAPIGKRPRAGLAAILLAGLLLVFWAAHGIGDTVAGSEVFNLPVTLQRVIMAGPAALLLVWGGLQLEPFCKGRISAALSYLGDASYSLYLAHPPVVLAAAALWRSLHAPLIGFPIFVFGAGLGAGVLAYEKIEKPILAGLRKRLTGRPVAVAAG